MCGIAIPNEIGYATQYFIDNLRKYLKPKENVKSIWVNKQRNVLGMIVLYFY